MDDKELLKCAAKAVGISVYTVYPTSGVLRHPQDHDGWNPLTNDSDAFRLAGKLKLNVCTGEACAVAITEDGCKFSVQDNDPIVALRRVIVKAAAAIGEEQNMNTLGCTNPKVGDLVRCFDFPGDTLHFYDGIVTEVGKVVEDCPRITVRCVHQVSDGAVKVYDKPKFIMPPMNGIRTTMGRVTDGVVVL